MRKKRTRAHPKAQAQKPVSPAHPGARILRVMSPMGFHHNFRHQNNKIFYISFSPTFSWQLKQCMFNVWSQGLYKVGKNVKNHENKSLMILSTNRGKNLLKCWHIFIQRIFNIFWDCTVLCLQLTNTNSSTISSLHYTLLWNSLCLNE